jgi:hypothetical protein
VDRSKSKYEKLKKIQPSTSLAQVARITHLQPGSANMNRYNQMYMDTFPVARIMDITPGIAKE